jgi:hypothetical protein
MKFLGRFSMAKSSGLKRQRMACLSSLPELEVASRSRDSGCDHLMRVPMPRCLIPSTFQPLSPSVRAPATAAAKPRAVAPLPESTLLALQGRGRLLLFVLPGICAPDDMDCHGLFDATADLRALSAQTARLREIASSSPAAATARAAESSTSIAALMPVDLLTASRMLRALGLDAALAVLCDADQAVARAWHLPAFQIPAALLPRSFGAFESKGESGVPPAADTRLDDFGIVCALPRRVAISICAGCVEKVWYPYLPPPSPLDNPESGDDDSSAAQHDAGHSIASIVDWAIECDRRERAGGGIADADEL